MLAPRLAWILPLIWTQSSTHFISRFPHSRPRTHTRRFQTSVLQHCFRMMNESFCLSRHFFVLSLSPLSPLSLPLTVPSTSQYHHHHHHRKQNSHEAENGSMVLYHFWNQITVTFQDLILPIQTLVTVFGVYIAFLVLVSPSTLYFITGINNNRVVRVKLLNFKLVIASACRNYTGLCRFFVLFLFSSLMRRWEDGDLEPGRGVETEPVCSILWISNSLYHFAAPANWQTCLTCSRLDFNTSHFTLHTSH